MAELTLVEAVNDCLHTELARDGSVLVMGEDVGRAGGVFRATAGLLDRFGYRDRNGDGFREMPDGAPLVIRIASEPDQTARQYDELWQRSLAAVGLKVEFQKQKCRICSKRRARDSCSSGRSA